MKKEFIFDKCHDFDECHASTLVELSKGDYMAAWFGGTKEGKSDVAIWGARRINGQWENPVRLAKVSDAPHWNPVLFKYDGIIYLYFKIGRSIKFWHTRVMHSCDNGVTWSSPVVLVPGNRGGRGPVKNKPVILSNGTWAAPASVENKWYNAFVDLSYDHGKTWVKAKEPKLNKKIFAADVVPDGLPDVHGVIQPALWESSPGSVHMLLRSSCGRICRSDSNDYGVSWNEVYRTGMPNNNSGLDVAKLSDSSLVMLCNPVAQNWGKRTPISLFTSDMEGVCWTHCTDFETDDGEYSYPAVIPVGSGWAATYTWNRKKIVLLESSL